MTILAVYLQVKIEERCKIAGRVSLGRRMLLEAARFLKFLQKYAISS